MPSSGRQLTLIILVIYGSHQIAITQEVQQQKQSKIDTHLKVYTQKIQRQDKTIQHQGNSAVGEEVTRETSQPINVHRSHHFSKVYRVLFKFRSSRNVGRFKRNATLNASATPPETNSSLPQNQDTTEPTQSNSTRPFVWPSHFLVTQPATSRGTSPTPGALREEDSTSSFFTRYHTPVIVVTVVVILLICAGITYAQVTMARNKRRKERRNTMLENYYRKIEKDFGSSGENSPCTPDMSSGKNVNTQEQAAEDDQEKIDVAGKKSASKVSSTDRKSSVPEIRPGLRKNSSVSKVGPWSRRTSSVPATGLNVPRGSRPSNVSVTELDSKDKQPSKVQRRASETSVTKPMKGRRKEKGHKGSNSSSQVDISNKKIDLDEIRGFSDDNELYRVNSEKDFFYA